MVAEAVLYKLVEVITLHSWCYVWVCVPFAPLSHDSCCTSLGFCFVWSVCGLALLTVNAEFFIFYHCLKATSLNSMGGHHIFTNVHSSIMSCPYNAGFFLRTVSTLWLRRRFLLCISVFQHRRWSFSRWSQRAVSNHPSYWWTCFLMGLVLPRTVCLHSIQKQG